MRHGSRSTVHVAGRTVAAAFHAHALAAAAVAGAAGPARGVAAVGPCGPVRPGRARRRGVAPGGAPRRRLALAPGPACPARPALAAAARMDLAGAGAGSARACGARAAGPLPFRPRCAAGRPDALLRHRRRRRGTASGRLRRVPAAGPRATALARRTRRSGGRRLPGRRLAAARPAAFRAGAGVAAGARRHALPAAALGA